MIPISKNLLNLWQTRLYSLRNVSSVSGSKEERSRQNENKGGEWRRKSRLLQGETYGDGWIMRLLRADLDLRPHAVRRWLETMKEEWEIHEQRFIPRRHHILGNNLATAHFILYRGGRVKFLEESDWRVGKKHNLPLRFVPGYNLEAVDASNVNLYYEGLRNFTDLKSLKSLSFRNCCHLNEWCLDYISGEFPSLESLDLHNCRNVTANGLACLYRLNKLKLLNVSSISQEKDFQLTCLLLEDTINGLKVEGVDYIKI